MNDTLKTWLLEQIQELADARNNLEIDRVLLQGRQEALAAVLTHLDTPTNEDTQSESPAESEPTPIAAVSK